MLRIRLTRKGKKRQPTYRVVVADSESPRDGRYVEQIGHYDPMVDPIAYSLNEGRALHWLSVGAQPSDAVLRLLNKQGTMDRLVRLRAGEELDALVAEFEGTEYTPEADDEDKSVVEAVQERASAAVESAVETVQNAAASAAAAAASVVSSIADAVSGDSDDDATAVDAGDAEEAVTEDATADEATADEASEAEEANAEVADADEATDEDAA